jgi:putative phosphoribosyl transferase
MGGISLAALRSIDWRLHAGREQEGHAVAAFADRVEGGRALAERLQTYRGTDAQIVGMARGGVMVGLGVAEGLALPLRTLVVRKLGAPHNPELALGAVSETGQLWIDRGLVLATGASDTYLEEEIARQVAEARRRTAEYATATPIAPLEGRTAILVDDGIATGASALVGVRSARDLGAARVVLATPVASPQAARALATEANEVVVLSTPDPFVAVGLYYDNFDQTTDAEVIGALRLAHSETEAEPWMN